MTSRDSNQSTSGDELFGGSGSSTALFSQEELAQLKLIFPGMPQREVLNAFRDVRTRLMQKSGGKPFVVLVSSLGAEDRSSYVATNLATAIAMDEQNSALYIDCNLDNPGVCRFLRARPKHGLTDYLDDESLGLRDIVYPSGIERLSVIPVGNPRVTAEEHLASNRMRELIDSLRNRYVVIDVPPASVSVVGRIVSQMVDHAVLAVPFGQVSQSQILSGIDAVGEQRFAGLVFNY